MTGKSFRRNLPAGRKRDHGSEMTSSPSGAGDLKSTGVATKIWIPLRLEQKLDRLAELHEVSRSALIRNLLFEFVFGKFEFEMGTDLDETRERLRQLPPIAGRRLPGKRTGPNSTPELGKNSRNVKVWLSHSLAQELAVLAQPLEIPLSQFLREILVTKVLGHVRSHRKRRSEGLSRGENPEKSGTK
jgi:hypothetical protein